MCTAQGANQQPRRVRSAGGLRRRKPVGGRGAHPRRSRGPGVYPLSHIPPRGGRNYRWRAYRCHMPKSKKRRGRPAVAGPVSQAKVREIALAHAALDGGASFYELVMDPSYDAAYAEWERLQDKKDALQASYARGVRRVGAVPLDDASEVSSSDQSEPADVEPSLPILDRLAISHARLVAAEEALRQLVVEARASTVSWADIGRVVDLPADSARYRWGRQR